MNRPAGFNVGGQVVRGRLPEAFAEAFGEVRQGLEAGGVGHLGDRAAAARQITSGCSAEPLAYCPGAEVTWAQLVALVTRTFSLVLYGP